MICCQSRDVEVEGVLIYLLNYQRGTRYPFILAMHGGFESRVVTLRRGVLPYETICREGNVCGDQRFDF
ncbi:MAG: hypothetical protein M2R45_02871 [Verrucomicrobia subdivision 3 bacterium]|nr:hypothetical protein [Limisphaerales bacterium]MCS1414723.1 hypothetical protein [Limisphaerales bacterium]